MKVRWRAVALAVGGKPEDAVVLRPGGADRSRPAARAVARAPVPARSPRVLGVDDFAFRRSRTYGTIVLDVDTSTVIDVLPDRTSETLAAWLIAHPGAEIVCRDRDSGYSRAVREAAPDAIEVADRFHFAAEPVGRGGEDLSPDCSCLRKHAEDALGQHQPVPPLPELPPLSCHPPR